MKTIGIFLQRLWGWAIHGRCIACGGETICPTGLLFYCVDCGRESWS
jgi:hypothetical protein